MRLSSGVKLALAVIMAAMIAIPAASAKTMKRSTDSCVFHRHRVANGSVCVAKCDPNSLGCAQQACQNGHWVTWLSCLRPFCFQPCG